VLSRVIRIIRIVRFIRLLAMCLHSEYIYETVPNNVKMRFYMGKTAVVYGVLGLLVFLDL
jgi:hypothetical protein